MLVTLKILFVLRMANVEEASEAGNYGRWDCGTANFRAISNN
jgi:hypothetical protein